MKRKRVIAALVILLLLAAYGARVYAVNHSELVAFAQAVTTEYSFGEDVELAEGYYNVGYLDLTGYYIKVTGTRIMSMDEYLGQYGYDESFYDTMEVSTNYQYVYLVDAVFWFDGENDPQDNVVDLSSFMLVGDDYSCSFSYELNALDGINDVLQNSYMFSISSGKSIELELPFLVDTESVWGLSEKYLEKHVPRLMVAQYPYEIYILLFSRSAHLLRRP